MSEARKGRLLRGFGWLLTPFVVWAASFVGGWLGAVAARMVGGTEISVGLMVFGAAAGGGLALVGWVWLLRR